ncbi:MAG TPA: DUF4249 domain-containing protein [Puia sp.]|nr:DUF4249 domain-containing protein [Puia sp.]
MKSKIWFLILILFWACKDKYMPHINYPASGILVVEGFINTGNGPTTISLTRVAPLNNIGVIPEPGADVQVESERGVSFKLSETGGGNYSIDQIALDSSQKYRVRIRTSNGKEYLSALTEVKITPPIDTVGFDTASDHLTIYVSTHDDRNKSVYYEWYYSETWKYLAYAFSNFKYTSLGIESRDILDADTLYNCWSSDQSNDILLASSENLSSDVISKFPVQTVSYFSSNRMRVRYSILVKQIVLTKDWYEWKQQLKKNTEQLGSIFDAQPSETGGNITCLTDTTERVIGFIGCTSEIEKRIFISRSQIPNVFVSTGYETCAADTVKPGFYSLFEDGSDLIISQAVVPPGIVVGYMGASVECMQCSLHGGTTVEPDFW